MGILSQIPKKVTNECQEVIDLYKHMINSSRKMQALKTEGKPYKDEDVRFKKLEIRSNSAWNAIKPEDHLPCVQVLVKEGYMSETVAECLIMFDGHIDHNPMPGPTIRLGFPKE